MELKEELYNTELASVWRKKQEYNLREVTKTVKDRRNDIKIQHIVAKMPEKSSLTLYRQMNCSWGKRADIDYCPRKEGNGIGCLSARVWKLKGTRRNRGKGIYPWCVGAEDVNSYYWTV
jgi:hypothetical protein